MQFIIGGFSRKKRDKKVRHHQKLTMPCVYFNASVSTFSSAFTASSGSLGISRNVSAEMLGSGKSEWRGISRSASDIISSTERPKVSLAPEKE